MAEVKLSKFASTSESNGQVVSESSTYQVFLDTHVYVSMHTWWSKGSIEPASIESLDSSHVTFSHATLLNNIISKFF